MSSLFTHLPSPMPTGSEQKFGTSTACSFKRIRSQKPSRKSRFSGYTRRMFLPSHAFTASQDPFVGCNGIFVRIIATVAVGCCVERPSLPCSMSFVAVLCGQRQRGSCQILEEQSGIRPAGMSAMASSVALPSSSIHAASSTSIYRPICTLRS